MKSAVFLGDARQVVSDFPEEARGEAGHEIYRVQTGLVPRNWKPMNAVGMGVKEIRIQEDGGTYRVIYTANFADAVYILHAFQKKTQKTSARDIAIAAMRFKQLKVQR